MYSPNMLKTFQTCPKKYFYKYVEGISVPQKASFFEKGKKIHALANYYLRGDNIEKLEKVLNADEQRVWESLKTNEFFQKKYVNSEYNLSCRVGEYWVGGRLDAVVKDENSGEYFILDYKTGSIPKNPEYDFQTMVYLLCLSKKTGAKVSFVYIDLKNNQNCVIPFDAEKSNEYEKRIVDICDKIARLLGEPEIERFKSCDFCEYGKICM